MAAIARAATNAVAFGRPGRGACVGAGNPASVDEGSGSFFGSSPSDDDMVPSYRLLLADSPSPRRGCGDARVVAGRRSHTRLRLARDLAGVRAVEHERRDRGFVAGGDLLEALQPPLSACAARRRWSSEPARRTPRASVRRASLQCQCNAHSCGAVAEVRRITRPSLSGRCTAVQRADYFFCADVDPVVHDDAPRIGLALIAASRRVRAVASPALRCTVARSSDRAPRCPDTSLISAIAAFESPFAHAARVRARSRASDVRYGLVG